MNNPKNMDSVFANCTDDELEFDVFFDDDDSIIDIVAGVDEAGNPVTGEDFDFSALTESEDDLVGENPDFDYQKDGDASGSEKDAEGTVEKDLEVGGEVGDGKEVTGKENSAESKADDVKDEEEAIGVGDKQQTSLEAAEEGPLEDDDVAEREGEVPDTAVSTEEAAIDALLGFLNESDEEEDDVESSEDDVPAEEVADEKCCKETNEVEVPEGESDDDVDYSEGEADKPVGESFESLLGSLNESDEECGDSDEEVDPAEEEEPVDEAIDFLLNALDEADEVEVEDNLTGADDAEKREGEVDDTKNVEAVKQEIPVASVEKDNNEDPIADDCDTAAREGEVKADDNVEGVKTAAVGAALEGSDFVDTLLAELDDDDDLISAVDAEEVVADDIKTDGTSNNDIEVKEAAEVAEELLEDPDDEDIEAIDSNDEPTNSDDYEYELDDDELIDAVDKGIDALI